ncbi:hypothetical protein Tco_1516055 [Tanacetum coccineum]
MMPCIFTPRLQFLQGFASRPSLMILGSYGSKGLLPYGFERGDGWCEFEWRYKGAIYSRLELGGVSKPHDLIEEDSDELEYPQELFSAVDLLSLQFLVR